MGRWRWSAASIIGALALGVGCGGGDPTIDGGGLDGGAGADGSAPDAAPRDAGPVGADAGSSDAGNGDGGGPLDGGSVACGDGSVDGLGVADNCRRPECFESATCTEQQLAAQGHIGFTPCGSPLAIDPSSSNEACLEEPPFGGLETPRMCGLIDYSGQVTFFCSPDGSELVARFSASFSPPSAGTGIYYYLGHDYWSGSGGGSGDSYSVSWPTDDFGERFVGYQAVDVPASGSTRLNVWFMSGDLMSTMYIAGGFATDVPTP